jgi:hypothetical protein
VGPGGGVAHIQLWNLQRNVKLESFTGANFDRLPLLWLAAVTQAMLQCAIKYKAPK